MSTRSARIASKRKSKVKAAQTTSNPFESLVSGTEYVASLRKVPTSPYYPVTPATSTCPF